MLVNTTAGEMDLARGNVSQALLLSAGPALQQECDAQVVQADGTRNSVAAGDFIETGPANLKCKKVYHCHCKAYNQTSADQVGIYIFINIITPDRARVAIKRKFLPEVTNYYFTSFMHPNASNAIKTPTSMYLHLHVSLWYCYMLLKSCHYVIPLYSLSNTIISSCSAANSNIIKCAHL